MPINISSNFVIERDEVYASTTGATFYAFAMYPFEFVNYGVIRATGSGAIGFSSSGSNGLIHNAGLMDVRSDGAAYGFYSGSHMAAVRNTGRIVVSGSEAHGMLSWSPSQVFDNAGQVTVTGTGAATGVRLVNGGTITNTGTITVSGGTSAMGVYIDRFEYSTFENRGTIVAHNAGGLSYGIVVSGLVMSVTGPNITNRGVVTADIAVSWRNAGYSPQQDTVEYVVNYGTLNGDVVLAGGADILDNRGVINGDILMGAGADRVDLTVAGVNGIIDLGDDDDTATGSAGADVIYGGLGRDTVRGGGGADVLSGDQGSDTLSGGDGDDALSGGSGSDTLSGGGGDDTIEGGTGDDTIDGGAGIDTVVYAGASADFTITTTNGVTTVASAALGIDTLTSVDRLRFTDRTIALTAPDPARVIVGGAAAETLSGGTGDDVITGGGGGDTLAGDSGADTFRYTATSDSTASARDTITDFQAGLDRLDLTGLNASEVSLIREGANTFVFATTPNGPFQVLVNGVVQGSDVIYGNRQSIFLIGSSGSDVLIGGSQGDPILGNDGDDIITGGLGPDAMHGGAGRDTFVIRTAAESVAVNGAYDNYYDFTTGEDRIDVTALGTTAISVLRQTDGSSVIFGNSASGDFVFLAAGRAINGTDFVYGNNHSVFLVGSSAGETLIGSDNADPVLGGGGDDILIGAGGADSLEGGAGVDIFRYRAASDSTLAASDRIQDFQVGTDKIDLSAIHRSGNDRYGIAYDSGGSFLFVDLGGNGTNDMLIQLKAATITAADIIWGTGTGASPIEGLGKDPGPAVLPFESGDAGDLSWPPALSVWSSDSVLTLDDPTGPARYDHDQTWWM